MRNTTNTRAFVPLQATWTLLLAFYVLAGCHSSPVKPVQKADTDTAAKISQLTDSQVALEQSVKTWQTQVTEQISGLKVGQGALDQNVKTLNGNLTNTQSQVTSFATDPERRKLEEARIQADMERALKAQKEGDRLALIVLVGMTAFLMGLCLLTLFLPAPNTSWWAVGVIGSAVFIAGVVGTWLYLISEFLK